MAKRNRARCSTNRRKPEARQLKQNNNQEHGDFNIDYKRGHNGDFISADIYTLHPHLRLDTAYSPARDRNPLEPRTKSQKQYMCAIKNHCLTFGIGPAGTGKSYCATAMAAEALAAGRIERIILTRPAVEAGEQLGHLPGDLNEKFSVYIDPFRDILVERLGKGAVDYNLRHGRIVAAPLAFMRGKTFGDDAFVILDEAQNTSIAQMKMFLTRIGEDCKVVVNGDINQSDIRGQNGLADAIYRLQGLASVKIHEFERSDIVRSGLVRQVIDRYEVDLFSLREEETA